MKRSSPQKQYSEVLHSPYFLLGLGLLMMLIAAGITYAVYQGRMNTSNPTPLPTRTTSPAPTMTPESTASASPTVTGIPTASATPASTAVSQLPTSAQTVVSGFYTAYEARNTADISSYFTADTTGDLQSLHALLFTGKDTDGVPGGPTLFVSSTVLEHPTHYTVTATTSVNGDWQLTVQEQRVDGNGKALAAENFTLIVTENGSTWGISQYAHAGSTGKYDGFFTE